MGITGIRCEGVYAKSLREYGALVGKIDHCIEDINTLGHKIRTAEERRHMAGFDLFPDLEKYDRAIKTLTEARSCLEKEISGYEQRELELRQVFYDGTGIRDHDAAYSSSLRSQKNGQSGKLTAYAIAVERDFADLTVVTEKYSEPLS